jgi:uncharacterized protein YgiM (DUF1202 family)
MKTLKIIAVVVITLAVVAGTGLFLVGYFKPKPAGIRVDTTPSASVYIDGELAGRSPLRETFSAGTISLKLVPDSSSGELLPYETKITLTSGIETVVRREFAATEDLSSGDVISFEKNTEKKAGLVVISTPDNAQVSIDGVARGFAPYKNSSISPAEHQITVRSPGYTERVMTVNTISGYRLTVYAKLAKESQQVREEAALPTPVSATTSVVEILETPTGFLRVRTLPGTKGEEIAEVKPGEKFLYIETDEASGWYKIQYRDPAPGLPDGISGWVSNQYAKTSSESGTLQGSN